MTKRSPCQFGLAPRGDLPTAFEVGSRAPSPQRGQGAGVPQTLPPPPQHAPRSGVQQGQDPRHMGTWQQDPWDGTDCSVPTPRVGTGAGAPAHAVHGTHALCTGTRTPLHQEHPHAPSVWHRPQTHRTRHRPQRPAPCTRAFGA